MTMTRFKKDLWICLLPGLLTIPFSMHCLADEFIARAEVLSAVPVTRTTHKKMMSAECKTGKPEIDDLVTLLEWDLGVGYCEKKVHEETSVTGYLIEYQWQGRTYTQTTHENPGRYLPIKVSVK